MTKEEHTEIYTIPHWASVILLTGMEEGALENEITLYHEFLRSIQPFQRLVVGDHLGFCAFNDVDKFGGDCFQLKVIRSEADLQHIENNRRLLHGEIKKYAYVADRLLITKFTEDIKAALFEAILRCFCFITEEEFIYSMEISSNGVKFTLHEDKADDPVVENVKVELSLILMAAMRFYDTRLVIGRQSAMTTSRTVFQICSMVLRKMALKVEYDQSDLVIKKMSYVLPIRSTNKP